MKFLCIGYYDPAKMDARPKDEIDAIMQQCPAHMDTLYRTDKVAMVVGVDPEVRYLRRVDGEISVLDHGLGGSPNKIGCVFLIEAADFNEATRLAALHPTTQIPAGEHLDWYTEVRPIQYFQEGGSRSE